ncbi:YihY/virulence factor BrkB family protein [Nesterenkonia sp. F]|uniref:YihY/virulence factor BrkB family protein n=1 Tax=Nesterenkonia sp. F TaxID=795955 RepID=UPI000255D187|nr:YihY/virulence factor BrkB family protein [Nesterenkonia sp. F]
MSAEETQDRRTGADDARDSHDAALVEEAAADGAWSSSAGSPGSATGGLAPHRASPRSAADHDVFGEDVVYADADRPGTVAAAADQPDRLKTRQRQEHAASGRDAAKPRTPFSLRPATWWYSLRRAIAEFGRDQCPDSAAALTYFAVLSVFPALIALVSLLSVVGEGKSTREFLLTTLDDLLEADVESMSVVQTILKVLTEAPGAGIGLAVGILTALWTASNYVNAFSRAMNRIYEVPEGRSPLVLRPVLYGVTAALVVLVALSAALLAGSGGVVEAIGEQIGLSSTAELVWSYARYPALLVIAAACIALLYHTTPNIRQPGVLWVAGGALLAIVVLILATIGVAVYITNAGNYEATYGALAGVIIFLLWIYIANVVLLLGAEVDAELERGRQLQAGIEAERTIMLPLRSTAAADKAATKYEKLVAQGQALRLTEGRTAKPDDVWRR